MQSTVHIYSFYSHEQKLGPNEIMAKGAFLLFHTDICLQVSGRSASSWAKVIRERHGRHAELNPLIMQKNPVRSAARLAFFLRKDASAAKQPRTPHANSHT
ncbi:hypothetical protein LJR029_004929 [Caballeronia sp. LjRoot29]